MSDLTSLFKPKTVALIGASSDTRKYGYWTAKSLYDNEFKGDIYLISKSGKDILGHQTYPSVMEVPAEIDLAIVAIAPAHILTVLEECLKKGVKSCVVVSTGFGEVGPEGKELEKKMLKICRAGQTRMMGPNCMGLYSASVSLNGSIIDLQPGPMSLILQSGNFGIDINLKAKSRKLGYSCWATIGNQVDIRFHDFVDYVGTDQETKVLLLYMEGLKVDSVEDGRKFLEVAKKTSLEKPIVAIKIGRSEAGARAAASHTGSLAGSEKIFDSALKQCGIIRVDSPTEILDVAEAFAKCKPAQGARVAILTDGGGHGVMATDLAEKFGLSAPVLSEETQKKIRSVLMPHCPIKNPVDLAGTPEANMWVFDQCAEILLNDPEVDGLVIVGLYGGYADLSEEFRQLEIDVAKSLAQRVAQSQKPVVMHSIYQSVHPESLDLLRDSGLPVYDSIEAAMRSMGALVQYQGQKGLIAKELNYPEPDLPHDRLIKAKVLINEVKKSGRQNLVETEARDLLLAYGLDLPPCYLAKNAHEARLFYEKLGQSLAMKIVSPDILHKTEAGGVALKVNSPEMAELTFAKLVANGKNYRAEADIFGVLLTPMLEGGLECIIGASRDLTFGPTVMFGLGGIFVEILKDISFRVAPVKLPECLAMIESIKGLPLLKGARGAAKSDLKALAQTICALSYLMSELPEVAEIDLNPVFAKEKGLSIADARVVLAEPQ
ncbi:MAG: acetate--CoA ligase family protein [Deltaproteobacteria bacterium]|jgi:acetyltransferase|nr:acetate--CoA ligase family protein [Deltaproteobacteria bacterium]